jgi:hypothetical protein
MDELKLACLRCGHSWLRRSLDKLPGTCPGCCSRYWNRPRKGEKAPKPRAPRSQLTRKAALQVAADLIHSLQGYRKTADYRVVQNDLNLLCEALQRASVAT